MEAGILVWVRRLPLPSFLVVGLGTFWKDGPISRFYFLVIGIFCVCVCVEGVLGSLLKERVPGDRFAGVVYQSALRTRARAQFNHERRAAHCRFLGSLH